MLKEWYIRINRKTEGPYSIFDLKRDLRLTPDTLAWRPGMTEWAPIYKIPELKELFTKDEEPKEEKNKKPLKKKVPEAKEVLTLEMPPPHYFFWLVLLILVLLFLYSIFYS